MGSLLMAAGAKGKRYSLPHSRIMVHQPSGGFQGQATDIEIHAREILTLRGRLNQIYVKHAVRVRHRPGHRRHRGGDGTRPVPVARGRQGVRPDRRGRRQPPRPRRRGRRRLRPASGATPTRHFDRSGAERRNLARGREDISAPPPLRAGSGRYDEEGKPGHRRLALKFTALPAHRPPRVTTGSSRGPVRPRGSLRHGAQVFGRPSPPPSFRPSGASGEIRRGGLAAPCGADISAPPRRAARGSGRYDGAQVRGTQPPRDHLILIGHPCLLAQPRDPPEP